MAYDYFSVLQSDDIFFFLVFLRKLFLHFMQSRKVNYFKLNKWSTPLEYN